MLHIECNLPQADQWTRFVAGCEEPSPREWLENSPPTTVNEAYRANVQVEHYSAPVWRLNSFSMSIYGIYLCG
jgi:hypothetical protein